MIDEQVNAAEKHILYMKEALAEAEKAFLLGEVPVGAVVVYNDRIIGRGHNLRETMQDGSAHAEIVALRQAAALREDWRLSGSSIYTTVEPCPMCAGALLMFRVENLIYGVKDPKAGAVDSLIDIVRDTRFNHQVKVISGVLEEECKDIIQKFFQQLRKKEEN
ncbi:MAG: CMP/dCMP deaminase zinc-binding [Desulfotomaculum sp. 46_80]|nr:MAG: CMP/dCMP deaminase zinc-binding [Desulfotomaculum sp. 46_80]